MQKVLNLSISKSFLKFQERCLNKTLGPKSSLLKMSSWAATVSSTALVMPDSVLYHFHGLQDASLKSILKIFKLIYRKTVKEMSKTEHSKSTLWKSVQDLKIGCKPEEDINVIISDDTNVHNQKRDFQSRRIIASFHRSERRIIGRKKLEKKNRFVEYLLLTWSRPWNQLHFRRSEMCPDLAPNHDKEYRLLPVKGGHTWKASGIKCAEFWSPDPKSFRNRKRSFDEPEIPKDWKTE